MQSVRCILPDRIDYGNKGQGIENTDKLEVVKILFKNKGPGILRPFLHIRAGMLTIFIPGSPDKPDKPSDDMVYLDAPIMRVEG